MNDNGAYDRLSGKAKEVAGKVTDDKETETETEGRLQQAEGRVKSAVDDARGVVEGAVDRLKNDK